MRNTLIIILIVGLYSFSLNGQSKYEQGMEKAFQLLKEKDVKSSVAMFERIGQAEKDKWLPMFHAAHTLIWNSFGEGEKEMREGMLEQAKALVEEAHKRSPDNAEILSIEAMLYTSYMAFDPATYGMMYSMKIEGLHNKAYHLAPDNPRVLSGKIQYDKGKAAFFGQDTSVFCNEMKKIIPKFKAETLTALFSPNHGLRQAEMFVQDCDE